MHKFMQRGWFLLAASQGTYLRSSIISPPQTHDQDSERNTLSARILLISWPILRPIRLDLVGPHLSLRSTHILATSGTRPSGLQPTASILHQFSHFATILLLLRITSIHHELRQLWGQCGSSISRLWQLAT
jgi:hypothetical protein